MSSHVSAIGQGLSQMHAAKFSKQVERFRLEDEALLFLGEEFERRGVVDVDKEMERINDFIPPTSREIYGETEIFQIANYYAVYQKQVLGEDPSYAKSVIGDIRKMLANKSSIRYFETGRGDLRRDGLYLGRLHDGSHVLYTSNDFIGLSLDFEENDNPKPTSYHTTFEGVNTLQSSKRVESIYMEELGSELVDLLVEYGKEYSRKYLYSDGWVEDKNIQELFNDKSNHEILWVGDESKPKMILVFGKFIDSPTFVLFYHEDGYLGISENYFLYTKEDPSGLRHKFTKQPLFARLRKKALTQEESWTVQAEGIFIKTVAEQ